MSHVSVYVTAPDRESAMTLARTLVGERLAACANIILGVTSVYRWEGEVEETEEVALILKTATECFDALSERVRALHSYSVPCVVAWPIVAGNPEYLEWVGRESRACEE